MTTDIVIGFFLILFIWEGWSNGLLRTLIGPVCVILCCLFASLYFDVTDNIVIAFFIAVAGSVILGIIVSVLFMWWRKSVDKKYRNAVFPGSRTAGAAISLTWLGGLTIAAFLLFAFLPTSLNAMQKIQQDIDQSRICQWSSDNIFTRMPLSRRIFSVLSIFKDKERLTELTNSIEFKTFLADPKVEAIAQDPRIVQLCENKRIVTLLFHPKITGLLRDSRVMQKLTRVIKMVYAEEPTKTKEEPSEEESAISQDKTLQKSAPEDPDLPAGQ